MKIPFTKTTFDKKEEEAVKKCFRSGWVVLGPKTLEFEEAFAKYVGADYAVFVDSGTAALFLALKASIRSRKINVEYINIPSLTFVSDIEVVIHAGLEPFFVDIHADTLCIDGDLDYTMPTNFAGRLAKCRGVVVDSCHRIEKDDVSHNPDAMWCYSFYATKNMSTVQGGMIVTNSKSVYEWLKKARDHGTTKGTKQRYEGKNPVYDVSFLGWRMKGDDMRASIGIEQLKKLPENNRKRNKIVARYNDAFGLNRTGNHLYYILVNNREGFIKKMLNHGVQCSVHFRPIHTLSAFKKYDRSDGTLNNTNYVADKIVSLPMYPSMTDEEIDYVIDKALKTNLII